MTVGTIGRSQKVVTEEISTLWIDILYVTVSQTTHMTIGTRAYVLKGT